MKKILFALVFFPMICCGQTTPEINGKKSNHVIFTATVDTKKMSKDGLKIDDYVIGISRDSVTMLNGKKVRIVGDYVEVEGPKPTDAALRQGREGKTKYIQKPTVTLIP